ncbi:MAG: porin family protein [candidate division KSB1 bacterium]|nr:porin family protein [candidate division KSB1 bacterium]MDZ7272953.1 porin family protein [candidate division KSB1 bacterium]MDZ7285057.1 porin family protein [candidate division KSB1 bacterium]MDZ7298089.1 porin family protein [candidate division KSB1 bacterium]MDZ7309525.1 porin family protein [candidate division KSB1 bacterium]
MKTKTVLLVALTVVLLLAPRAVRSQPAVALSNIGLKLDLGAGSERLAGALNLEPAGALALHLGYGVSQPVTLWLGLQVSKHVQEELPELQSGMTGVELNLQYKLRPFQRFRPYGKVGLGGFILETEATQITLTGGGVVWALGVEYRLAKFLSLGGEFYWKDFDFDRRRLGHESDFEKLEDPLPGDSRGFMLHLTLQ